MPIYYDKNEYLSFLPDINEPEKTSILCWTYCLTSIKASGHFSVKHFRSQSIFSLISLFSSKETVSNNNYLAQATQIWKNNTIPNKLVLLFTSEMSFTKTPKDYYVCKTVCLSKNY